MAHLTHREVMKLKGLSAVSGPGSGTVTGVTGTSPIVSSGGTAPDISLANKITMTATSPVTVSGTPTVIAGSAVAISLINDAAATITEVDTGVLANIDTVIPTSKAVKTAIAAALDFLVVQVFS